MTKKESVTESKADPSDETITIKVSTGKTTKKATSGSLDDFLIRQTPVTPEKSQQKVEDDQEDLTSVPEPLVSSPCSNGVIESTFPPPRPTPSHYVIYYNTR